LFNTEVGSRPGNGKLGDIGKDSSLIGYWPLEDERGEVKDYSGNNNDGYLAYSALAFDGKNDYVRINDSSSLDVGTITITAWVKRQQPCDDNAQIVNKLSGTGGYRLIGCGGGNQVQLSYGNGTTLTHVSGPQGVRRDRWSFVAATFNGSSISFMVDNTYNVLDAPLSSLAANSQPVDIGDPSTGLGSGPFKGIVDNVRIYNRDLSRKELLDLYNQRPVSSSGLVLHQAFEEDPSMCDPTASVFCLDDDSGNGNHGEANNFDTNRWNTGSGWANTDPDGTVRGQSGIRNSSAFRFDSEDDWIKVDYDSAENMEELNTDSLTFSAWIKPESMHPSAGSHTGGDHIAGRVGDVSGQARTTNTDDNWRVALGDQKIGFYTDSVQNYDDNRITGQIVNTGEWQHVTAVYDHETTEKRIYLNGRLVLSNYTAGSPPDPLHPNTNPVTIGSTFDWTNNDNAFDGMMDEVRIYSSALSSEQVKQLYSPSPGLLTTSLINGGYASWQNLSWSGELPQGTDVEARARSLTDVARITTIGEWGEGMGGWKYRRQVTIEELAGTEIPGPTAKFYINTQRLIRQGKLQPDCDDVRFRIDGKALDHWVEGGCNTNRTEMHLKLPQMNANEEKRVWMYYGNPAAPNNEDEAPHEFLTVHPDDSNVGSLWYYESNQDGTFDAGTEFDEGTYIGEDDGGIVVSDFSGGKEWDLVSFDTNNDVWRLWEDIGGAPPGEPTCTIYSGSYSTKAQGIDAGDLDNDGDMDIVSNRHGIWLENTGSCSWNQNSLPTSGDRDIVVEDFDEDGCADLAKNDGSDVTFFPGNCDGTFGTGSAVYSSSGSAGTDLWLGRGDFNEDRHYDLIINDQDPGDIYIYAGNGDGAFSQINTINDESYDHINPTVWDVNKDGHDDFVGTEHGDSDVHYFEGNGDGTFTKDPNGKIDNQPNPLGSALYMEYTDLLNTTVGVEQVLEDTRFLDTTGSYLSEWKRGSFNTVNWETSGGKPLEPVSQWRMNEGSGQFVNDSSRSNVGFLGSNASTHPSDPTWTNECRHNGCLSFDDTEYVRVSDSNSLDVKYITMSAWIKTDGTDTSNIVVNKENTYEMAAGWKGLSLAAAGNGCSTWCDGWMIQNAGAIQNNTWTHIATTWDGDMGRAYINGEQVAEADPSEGDGYIVSTSRDLGIGARDIDQTPHSRFRGQIDDVRIYNRSISPEEIRTLSNSPTESWQPTSLQTRTGRFKPGDSLIGSWSFEGTGSVVADSSRFGNNGNIDTGTDSIAWRGTDDWDSLASQENVVHDGNYDHPGSDTVQLGYNYGPESNLQAHYPLDTSVNTSIDVSGNNNDATAAGGTPQDQQTAILGTTGWRLDGNSALDTPLSYSGGSGPFSSSGGWTIIGWMKVHSSSNGERFYSLDCSEIFCLIDYNGNWRLCMDNCNTDLRPSVSINTGTWQLVTVVYDNANNDGEIWVDTTEIANGNVGSSVGGQSRCLTINMNTEGCSPTSANPDTTVDNIHVFQESFHSADIQNFYQTAFQGHINTSWKTFDHVVEAETVRLTDVQTTLNGDSLTAYVETDPDGDGTVEETSNPISLDGSGGPYSVTGLTTDTQRARVSVKLNSDKPTTTPEIRGFSLDAQYSEPARKEGYSGRGLSFNAEEGSTAVSDSKSLDVGQEITQTAWIKPVGDPTDNRGTIATKNRAYYFQHYIDDRIAVYTYWNNSGTRGGSSYFYSNSQVPRNEWTHVAWTEKGGTRKIYINGELDATGSFESSIWKSDATLELGAQNEDNRKFNGTIDEVKIFDRALSQEEIQKIAQVSEFTPVLENETGSSFDTTGEYTQYKINLLTGDTASVPSVDHVTLGKASDWSQWFSATSDNPLEIANGRYAQVQFNLTSTNATNTPLVDSATLGKDMALDSQAQFEDGNMDNTEADSMPGWLKTGQQDGYDTSLVGQWRFEDIDGRAVLDSSGNSHTGTFQGMQNNGTLGSTTSPDSNDPYWTPGCRRDGCLRFDGEDDFVSTEVNLDGRNTVTVTAWVKPERIRSQHIFGGRDDANNENQNFRLLGDGTIQWSTWDGSTNQGITQAGSYSKDSWMHVAGTFDTNNGYKLYKDGILIAESTDTTFYDNGVTETIGARETQLSNFFDGKIDDLRVYNRVLNPQAINQTMRGKAVDGSVAHWPLDTGYGQTAFNTAFWQEGVKDSGGISFDGSDDYVQLPDSPQLEMGTDDLTAMAWVRTNSSSAQRFVDTGARSTGGYSLFYSSGTNSFLPQWHTGSNRQSVGGGPDISDGQWHHVAAVWDRDNRIRAYVDGELVDSEVPSFSASTYIDNSFVPAIGAEGDASSQFVDGRIDDVRVISRALSGDEIRDIYDHSEGRYTSQFIDFSSGTEWERLSWNRELMQDTNVSARVHTARNVDRDDSKQDWDRGTTSFSTQDDLIGYWPLEGPGAKDRSGNQNHGDVINGVDTTEEGFIPQSNAYKFDNDDDVVNVTDSSSLDIDESFTWSMWVNIDTISDNDETVFGKRSAYELTIKRDRFKIVSWADDWYPYHNMSLTNQWHHIVITGQSDGSSRTLYIDGQKIASGGPSYTMDVSDYPLQIGRWPSGDGNGIDGRLDDLRIYDTRLTSREVRSQYSSMAFLSPWQDGNKNWINWDSTGGTPVSPDHRWRMDEAQGTVINDTVGDRHGRLGNGTSGTAPTWTDRCAFDSCLRFDGQDDFVNASGLAIDRNRFTWSAWVYHNSTETGWQSILRDIGTTNFQEHDSNIVGWYVANATGTDTFLNTDFTNQSWTHYTGTFNGITGTVRLYQDGQLVAEKSMDGPVGETYGYYIGSAAGGSEFFDGKIDDIRLFNQTLSPSEVNALYNAPTSSWQTDVGQVRAAGNIPDTDLIGAWSFEGTGQTVIDTSPARNHATLGINASMAIDDPSRTDGVSGRGIQFSGGDDVVRGPKVQIPSQYTITEWVRGDLEDQDSENIYGAGWRRKIALRHAAGGTTGITGILIRNQADNGYHNITTDINHLDGKWHHLAATVNNDTGEVNVYLDGDLVVSDTIPGQYQGAPYLSLGARQQGYGNFNGQYDEVRMYRTELSASQIQELIKISEFTQPFEDETGQRFDGLNKNPLGQGFTPEQYQYRLSTLTGDSTSLPTVSSLETASVSAWTPWINNSTGTDLDVPDARWLQIQADLRGKATTTPLIDLFEIQSSIGRINPAPRPATPTATNYTTKHAFNVSAYAADLSGGDDIRSCTVHASHNGSTYSFTGTVDTSFGGNLQAACNLSRVDTSLSGFDALDPIDVTVTFTDSMGTSANTTTITNAIPNRKPTIIDRRLVPLNPELNDDVTIEVEANDTEETTVWANFTVNESGTTIIDNENGSLTINADGNQVWNSTAFTLTNEDAIYRWSAEISDGYETTTTSGAYTLRAEPPNVTAVKTSIPEPWDLPAEQYRPGDTVRVTADISDINGPANLEEYNMTLISPDGTVRETTSLEETNTILNGYQVTGTATTVESAPTGIWTIKVTATDRDDLTAVNNTTVQFRTFNTTTLDLDHNLSNDDRYIDGETATPGTYTDLAFPYMVSSTPEILTGIINYGGFEQLKYGDSNGRARANITEQYRNNMYLLPMAEISISELERLEDNFAPGLFSDRDFLDAASTSFLKGPTDQKTIQVTLSYHNYPQININGFNGSITGNQRLTIHRGPATNDTVDIRIRH